MVSVSKAPVPLNSKVVDHHAQQQSVLTMVAWAQECDGATLGLTEAR